MNLLRLFSSVVILGFVTACESDLEQATDSLSGHWEIETIVSYYPDANGHQWVEQRNGVFGHFTFTDDDVSYEYIRNDTMYTDTTSWNLTSKKVNAGFSKIREFTLVIGNGEVYECLFEDQTKNAEKKASQVTLTTTTKVDFNTENAYELTLVRE